MKENKNYAKFKKKNTNTVIFLPKNNFFMIMFLLCDLKFYRPWFVPSPS